MKVLSKSVTTLSEVEHVEDNTLLKHELCLLGEILLNVEHAFIILNV